jgi:hypothetical protein
MLQKAITDPTLNIFPDTDTTMVNMSMAYVRPISSMLMLNHTSTTTTTPSYLPTGTIESTKTCFRMCFSTRITPREQNQYQVSWWTDAARVPELHSQSCIDSCSSHRRCSGIHCTHTQKWRGKLPPWLQRKHHHSL